MQGLIPVRPGQTPAGPANNAKNFVTGWSERRAKPPVTSIGGVSQWFKAKKVAWKVQIGSVSRCDDEASFDTKRADEDPKFKQDVVANDGLCLSSNVCNVVGGEDEGGEVCEPGLFHEVRQRLRHRSKNALVPDGGVGFVFEVLLKRIGDVHGLTRGADEQRRTLHATWKPWPGCGDGPSIR